MAIRIITPMRSSWVAEMRRPWRGGESMLPCNVIQVRKLLRSEVFHMVIDRTALGHILSFASQGIDIERFLADGSIARLGVDY